MFGLMGSKNKEVKDDVKVVLDLDAIEPRPVSFNLAGKRHIVKPVSVGQFGRVYDECVRIDVKAQAKKIDSDAISAAYAQALAPICPSITKDVIGSMTRKQQAAFFLFVFKVMSGEAFDMADIDKTDEKKN